MGCLSLVLCPAICLLSICILISGSPLPGVPLDFDEVCGSDVLVDRAGLTRLGVRDDADNEEAGKIWLQRYNELSSVVLCESVVSDWNYNTNLTDYNHDVSVSASVQRDSGYFCYTNRAYIKIISYQKSWMEILDYLHRFI